MRIHRSINANVMRMVRHVSPRFMAIITVVMTTVPNSV